MDEALTIDAHSDTSGNDIRLEIRMDVDLEVFYIFVKGKEICYGNRESLLELFKRALTIWELEESQNDK